MGSTAFQSGAARASTGKEEKSAKKIGREGRLMEEVTKMRLFVVMSGSKSWQKMPFPNTHPGVMA
jgi:hypothetical protein